MTKALPPSITTADIDWDNDHPVSRHFGDVYFSRDDGLAETRFVFIEQNRLPERFRRLTQNESFVIAETGFGTGLNFLASWQAWRENARANTYLHFVSFERYPLKRNDLTRALAMWPELEPLARHLLDQYPPPVKGLHRMVFDQGRVRLSIYFGDGAEALDEMVFTADAWFLDGFAPAKNPDLWHETLLDRLPGHSAPGTTVATFTAVGAVRRALIARGFAMEKTPGFGRKREMLRGRFDGKPRPRSVVQSVTIVGAGIAGCLLARNLAERGVAVRLIDRHRGPGGDASGNPQAALYVKPGVDFSPETEFAVGALLHAQRFYRQLSRLSPGDPLLWRETGLLQMAYDTREADRQRRLLARNHYPSEVMTPVSRERATELTGVNVRAGGLWFPASGSLSPQTICQRLIDHPGIQTLFGQTLERFTESPTDDHHPTILCAGVHSSALLPLKVARTLRFRAIRGQITQVPSVRINSPKAVVCGPGYICPDAGGKTTFGATFNLHETTPDTREQDHNENLDKVSQIIEFPWADGDRPDTQHTTGRVSFRATTHDRQPIASPVGESSLWVFSGLGSKGFSLAPILAEWLADRLTGQPQCLSRHFEKRFRLERCHSPSTPDGD